MRKLTTGLTLAAVAGLGLGLGPVAANAYGGGSYGGSYGGYGDTLKVIGLAGGTNLVRFDTDSPERTERIGTVRLTGDTSLVGIDYRVQNGALYGVGNLGGLYRIDATNAAATKVGQLTVALQGTSFGVDFNPAANALRVVSDAGQNLRQPFATIDDGIAGNDAATATDVALTTNGAATSGVSGAAYTNNDLDGTTATTLFDINTANDTVVIQSPANSGQLQPTGSLTVDFGPDSGFDIYSKVRDGKAVELFPYAVSGGKLYDVDLLNGKATLEGSIGTAGVTDIAIPLNQL